jgi:hypothetical protein
MSMRFEIDALTKRVARFRAFLSFFLVAAAQFMSPAAAADPASKIDPPAWSHRHSKEELQSYGARAAAQELEKMPNQMIPERAAKNCRLTAMRKMMNKPEPNPG